MTINIGFSTTCIFPAPLETTFQFASELGYDGIEIMISNDKATQDAETIMALEKKYNVEVISFHAPTLLLTHFVWGTDPEVKLRKTAELAETVGARTVVVHPPFAWQGKYSQYFHPIVKDIEMQTNVDIAVENMFPWRVKQKEMKAYSPTWEDTLKTDSKLTLDFSHAALSGLDVMEILPNIYDRISHIHLCDGLGQNTKNDKNKVFDEHLLPGQGNQPIKEALQFLKSKDWDGQIVAEINTRKAKSKEERKGLLAETLSWTRDALA